MNEKPAGRRIITLTRMILLGFVVGCLVGWLSPSYAVKLAPVSSLFLRLIKMVVGPLLLTTLVAGIAGISAKLVGWLAAKAIIWFEIATTVALFLGLGVANLVNPGAGAGATLAAVKPPTGAASPGFADFLINMVPTSIFDAMARNDVLQIVVFSILLGLGISMAGEKARAVKQLAEAGAEAMFKVVGFVMLFAPFGVGAAIAVTLGTKGVAVLLTLLKCVLALYGALLVFFVLLFVAAKFLTRAHMPTFLRAIREPALIAFTTASSEAALPRAMQVLEGLGIPRRIVAFVVPTGYAFNLDGTTLYMSLALVFIAQAGGLEMSWGEQLTAMLYLMLASKGVAGVPRAALVVLYGAVAKFGLPEEGLAMLIGFDAIMDMGRTCVNVVGNCVATLVVASWEKAIPADAPVLGPSASPPLGQLGSTDPPGTD